MSLVSPPKFKWLDNTFKKYLQNEVVGLKVGLGTVSKSIILSINKSVKKQSIRQPQCQET
jgi:hypothetical protein